MSVFCDHVLDDFTAWSKNISVILELISQHFKILLQIDAWTLGPF